MQPEPLKGKETCLNCLNTPCSCGMNNSAFIKHDVKSAVEWLKEELKETLDLVIYDGHEVEKTINKAFEDVK